MAKYYYATPSKYADIRGVSRPRISALLEKGVIKKTSKGLINVIKANEILDQGKALDKNTDSVRADSKISEIRQAQEYYKYLQNKLDYESAAGNLMPREECTEHITKQISVARAKLLSLPDKIVPLIVGMENGKKMREIIKKEVYAILTELSNRDNYK